MKLAMSFELYLLPVEKFEHNESLVSGTGEVIDKSQQCDCSY